MITTYLYAIKCSACRVHQATGDAIAEVVAKAREKGAVTDDDGNWICLGCQNGTTGRDSGIRLGKTYRPEAERRGGGINPMSDYLWAKGEL